MNNISYRCPYCLTDILLTDEFVICPQCNRYYHKECWDINNGCSIYDCRYQVEKSSESLTLNPEKLLIEVEYLYNVRCFDDAYIQCLRIIALFPNYIPAKALFNKVCFALSTKSDLLKKGEEALLRKDYLSAKKIYTELLNYIEDAERESLEVKIGYINHSIKGSEHRKKRIKLIQLLIFLVIVASLIFLYIHLIVNADKREFYRIIANTPETPQMIEAQIIELGQFLRKYPESTISTEAVEKIAQLSDEYIKLIYFSDWKKAIRYLNYIDSSKYKGTYKQDYNLLLSVGKNIVSNLIDSARELDRIGYFSHSRATLEQAKELSTSLKGMELLTVIIEEGLGILSRKISAGNKLNEVRKEIVEKKKQLDAIKAELGTVEKKTFMIKSKVRKNLYIAEDLSVESFCLLITESQLLTNEVIDIICEREKNIDMQLSEKERSLPKYREVIIKNSDINSDALLMERSSLEQRLNYLEKVGKKLDSILTKTF
ncbi:MAG: RING finger protein [Ignavibacteria bacterium]